METLPDINSKQWYPLKAFRLKLSKGNSFAEHVARFNAATNADAKPFSPTILQLSARAGEIHRVVKPLACNYVFLLASESQLSEFIKLYPQYQPLSDIASESKRLVAIPQLQMDNFIRLANAYTNSLPCYAPDEVDLEKGDKVKIIGGPFEGISGILQTQQGKEGGRVAVAVANLLAAETLDISPKYIQILQFAKGSKRIYDVLDSFTPRLEKAKEQYSQTGIIDTSNRAALQYFIRRYSSLNIPEPKMRAKHSLLLLAALHILLDAPQRDRSLEGDHTDALASETYDDQNPKSLMLLYQKLDDMREHNLAQITNNRTRARIIPLLP